MNITKVAALKTGDRLVVGNEVFVVTGSHQTGLHDLQVYMKSDLHEYEIKLPLFAGDKVQLAGCE